MEHTFDPCYLFYSEPNDLNEERPTATQVSTKSFSLDETTTTADDSNSMIVNHEQVELISLHELTNASSVNQDNLLELPSTSDSTNERKKIPVNEILAESVRGIFMNNENSSSYPSSGDISTDDFSDAYQEDVRSNGSVKRKRDRSTDDNDKIDPFSDSCRIPLPGSLDGPFVDCGTYVRRRNERERARVRSVNEGFERLRAHLPFDTENNQQQRLSKAETLHCAIQYINHLQSILDQE